MTMHSCNIYAHEFLPNFLLVYFFSSWTLAKIHVNARGFTKMHTSNPITGFGRLQKQALLRADIYVGIRENQLKNGYLSKSFTA